MRALTLTLLCTALGASACTRETARPPAADVYTPRVRELTVTTVPLLVKEQQKVFTFLAADFVKGGVLDGKEVYAFSPSTLTVVVGDTLHFTFINPEDDVHSFVLPDLAVSLPPQQITHATYVARRAGIFPFRCAVQTHLPMMWGQLVVLPASAGGGVETGVITSTAEGAESHTAPSPKRAESRTARGPKRR